MIPFCPYTASLQSVLYAPASDPSQDQPPRDALEGEASQRPLHDKRVVIVEDEGITQLQLRKICVAAGMQVVGMAADGEQGVRKVREMKPDLVLMDITMPVLDGLSATERILNEQSVCIIILTAYDLEEYKERAQNLGACGYIIKPVTGASLLPKVQAAYAEFHRNLQ